MQSRLWRDRYRTFYGTVNKDMTLGNMSSKREYFRWPESCWVSPNMDWKSGDFITGGCDIGSTSAQMVIMVDGQLYAYSNIRAKAKSAQSAQACLEKVLTQTQMRLEDIEYTVGTGYGRVLVPFAKREVTEISCHARGANFLYGNRVRTILDMGGQDLKVISCDDKGRMKNFIMNDKCAAGTGRGIETMAELLSVPIEDVGEIAAAYEGEHPYISPICIVFAKTDALRASKKSWSTAAILAAYCKASARQVYHFVRTLGLKREFCITGGIAKNMGIVNEVEKLVGVKALKPEFDTQIAGAVGAALYAKALAERERNGRRCAECR
jgi:bzd-type benzoyl-CoA reductase Q subunit